MGPPGSLTWPRIVEFFPKSMVLILWGLEVTPIPFSAMVDFIGDKPASGVMWEDIEARGREI